MAFYYVDIGDKLFCAQSYQSEANIGLQAVEPEKTHTNHFWIYDVSGSMHSSLPMLRDDLIAKMRKLPVGDTLTLAWFSSEKLYKYFLIAFEINKESDYVAAETLIRDNTRSLNLTCFSDSLLDVVKYVDVANKIKAGKNELTFLTDGFPVVDSYTKEVEKIKEAADKSKSLFDSILLVGYGSYYNRELMQKMAEWYDGSLVYSADFQSFSIALDEHIINTEDILQKKQVDLPKSILDNLIFSFYVNETNISLCTPNNGQILVPLTRKRNDRYVFSLINKAELPKNAELVNSADFTKYKGVVAQFVKGLYAAAILANQKCQTQLALDILAKIGDVSCIDSLNNAFTNDEYAKSEEQIKHFAINSKERFKIPRNENYLPKADAFCVLDVIKLLMEDEKACFLPYSDSFGYKRIGAKTIVQADVKQAFVADKSVTCNFDGLTWNQSLLNLSVRAKISGTIELPKDAEKYGLPKVYNTFIYRNYALIADGKLNIKVLPIKSSEATFLKLKENGVTSADSWSDSLVYDVKLDALPVLNRTVAKPVYSAAWLCEKQLEDLKLSAKLKVFKYFLEERTPVVASDILTFAEEKQRFLEENWITKSGFQPPTEHKIETDWYFAKSFEIKCKGLSSFPKVYDVVAKINNNKKLTKSDELIKIGIDEYRSFDGCIKDCLERRVVELKKEQLNIRHEIQQTKFAILVGKAWFSEFATREDELKIKIDDYEFTLCFGQEKIGF